MYIIIESRFERFFSFNEAPVVRMSSMLMTLSKAVQRMVQVAYITSQKEVVFWVGFFSVTKNFLVLYVMVLNLGGHSPNKSVCYSFPVVMQSTLRTA